MKDWYETEESTRAGLVTELRRIALRTKARPWRVLLLAALLTGAVAYKVVTKPRVYEADVVLSLSESEFSSERSTIPYDQLREYVEHTLLPDAKLQELIERHDLHRLRRKMGMQYAINELRDQLEIEIWKNSFVYYYDEEYKSLKSARIGVTVIDDDREQAFDIARDIALIAISEHEQRRVRAARRLTSDVTALRTETDRKLAEIASGVARRRGDLTEATEREQRGRMAVLTDQINELMREERAVLKERSRILASPDALAEKAALAGLGTSLDIVEERRPTVPERSFLALAIAIAVIGTGALIGSALLLGAFDSRIHDVDDLTRLGIPVFGTVPAFPGDRIGSLADRKPTS